MNHSHLTTSRYCVESYQRCDGEVDNFQYIHPRSNLLAFRGTDQLRDIYSDWKMTLHWRFRRELKPLFAHLLNNLDLQFPITLTGHSMGADIAKVMALEFVRAGYEVNQIIAFAPPRTGHFREIAHVPYAGYRNGPDLVTYGPGIRHQAPLIELSPWYWKRPPWQWRMPHNVHKMSQYNHLLKGRYG